MLWCWFDWYYTIQQLVRCYDADLIDITLYNGSPLSLYSPRRHDVISASAFNSSPSFFGRLALVRNSPMRLSSAFLWHKHRPTTPALYHRREKGKILRTKSRDAWHLSSLCLLRILDLLDVLWKGAIGVKWDALSMLDIWSLAFRLYFHLPRWTLDPFLSMPYPCPIPTSLSHPPSGQELEIIELTLYTAHNHLYASTLDNPDNWGIQVDQNTPEKIVRIDTLDSPGIGWTDKWVWPWNGRRGWSYL